MASVTRLKIALERVKLRITVLLRNPTGQPNPIAAYREPLNHERGNHEVGLLGPLRIGCGDARI